VGANPCVQLMLTSVFFDASVRQFGRFRDWPSGQYIFIFNILFFAQNSPSWDPPFALPDFLQSCVMTAVLFGLCFQNQPWRWRP
jgi:hypothetical protein